MPFITVKVPAGVLGDEAKVVLTNGICAAAAECEQVPDDPKMRALCVVTIEEISTGNRTYCGRDLSQMLVSLDALAVRESTLLDVTKRVYSAGNGPAVIVMSEMPGISPHVARFSRWVRDAGFAVYMPSLFGRDGAVPGSEEGAAVFQRACVS